MTSAPPMLIIVTNFLKLSPESTYYETSIESPLLSLPLPHYLFFRETAPLVRRAAALIVGRPT